MAGKSGKGNKMGKRLEKMGCSAKKGQKINKKEEGLMDGERKWGLLYLTKACGLW